jgi:hypothetical protein
MHFVDIANGNKSHAPENLSDVYWNPPMRQEKTSVRPHDFCPLLSRPQVYQVGPSLASQDVTLTAFPAFAQTVPESKPPLNVSEMLLSGIRS